MRGSSIQTLYCLVATLLLITSCAPKHDNNESTNQRDLPLLEIRRGIDTGLKFKNIIPENERMNNLTYEYYYNGGGVSIGDVTKDGLPDIYFTGNITPNKLYQNLGNLKFKDITDISGLKDTPSWTTGSTMVDINNDGIMDIYVCRSGKLEEDQRANHFFISKGMKDGHPIYEELAAQLGLDDSGYSTQALFFDFDRDNDLDMFLLNHNVEVKPYYDVTTLKMKRDPLVGDKLFENVSGKFIDVSVKANIIGHEIGYGLGVAAGDLNNDGWTDLYVGNDYSEHDYLYINNQDGTFTESSKNALGHVSNYSMGTDIADYNNDGMLDIAVMDMVAEDNYGIKSSMSGMSPELFNTHVENGLQHQYMYNTLQLNRGNEKFSEVAHLANISNTDWSWAPLFLDIDNDGFKDLFVTNGLKRDFRNNDYRNYKISRLASAEKNPNTDRKKLINELIAITPTKKTVNYVFRNNGDLTFTNKIEEWGIETPSYSNGLAFADLDNDGDLDLVANNIDEEPFIYKNNAESLPTHNYLKIAFAGSEKNRDGIGTRVTLKSQSTTQLQEHYLTRGYQSSVDKGLFFGLGKDEKVEELHVRWPDGNTQVLTDIYANQTLEIRYSESTRSIDTHVEKSVLAIKDETISKHVDFTHQENDFDDFEKELLLPHRMSRLGAGVSVSDVNGDGLEDYFMGGAAGQSGSLYVQNSEGSFEKHSSQPWSSDKEQEDIGALFFDADGDRDADLYIVSGGSEFDFDDSHYQDRLYINNGGVFHRDIDALPRLLVSGSRVVNYDFDQDGDQDLFVGGRQIPGNYPLATDSYILKNEGGKFVNASAEIAPELKGLGMVTDAVWRDYDNDGLIDLIVVGEWMPIVFFKNNGEQFEKQDQIKGIENTTGWWYSIASEDMDNDGDMDFIVGNNGLNYKHKASHSETFNIYAADFDSTGTNDIVLGYYDQGTLYPSRGRQCSAEQMPFIKEKFPTYDGFAKATLVDVYGDQKITDALNYKVESFASVYIENKGNGNFEMRPLPNIAQISAINKILTRDVNADNNLDLIIAGNNYSSEVETPRSDSGMGLILFGNGEGDFEVVDANESGLYLTGDVKDMELITLKDNVKGVLVSKSDDQLQLIVFKD